MPFFVNFSPLLLTHQSDVSLSLKTLIKVFLDVIDCMKQAAQQVHNMHNHKKINTGANNQAVNKVIVNFNKDKLKILISKNITPT